MNVYPQCPPRRFPVGRSQTEMSDCGEIHLADDELVTFVTASGKRYDVTAKDWGFYATPSVNGRLRDEGFRTALVRNSAGRHYVMLVEADRLNDFHAYLARDDQHVVEWLDERQ